MLGIWQRLALTMPPALLVLGGTLAVLRPLEADALLGAGLFLLVAEGGVHVLLSSAGLRLLNLEELAQLWQRLPRQAVDAVCPDPRARRGQQETSPEGIRGQVVGQHPRRDVPLLAANDLTYSDLCAAIDAENAQLIAVRERWMARLEEVPSRLSKVLDGVAQVGWVLVLVSLYLLGAVGLGSAVHGLLLAGVVMLSALPALVLYGVLSALVGLAAWLRAGALSVQAEQERAQAIQADAASRDSASKVLAGMRVAPQQTTPP